MWCSGWGGSLWGSCGVVGALSGSVVVFVWGFGLCCSVVSVRGGTRVGFGYMVTTVFYFPFCYIGAWGCVSRVGLYVGCVYRIVCVVLTTV